MNKRTTDGINVDKLDQLITDLGVRIKLWKSTVCPNVKSLESLDHNVNCTVCKHNMIDFSPVETIALFQQQDFHELFKIQGTFDADQVVVSFLSGQTLQMYTRVDVIDFREDFFELVQRQDSGNTLTDVLKYRAVEVLAAFAIRDNVLVQFYYGADFTLDPNGSIVWRAEVGHMPNDREVYSVYYRYHPIYRTIKAIHRDRFSQYNVRPDDIKAPKKQTGGHTYVKMPETWILKRDYLLDRRNSDGSQVSPNILYDPNT